MLSMFTLGDLPLKRNLRRHCEQIEDKNFHILIRIYLLEFVAL